MSHAERENLSALVDGELGPDQVRFMLRRTGSSVSLRATWSRYHTIRDGIRHEVCVLADAGFSDRVMGEIGRRVDAPGQRQSGRVHHWLRWSAGGAIAASVAAVALIVVQPQMRPTPVATPGGAQIAASHRAATPRAQPMAAPTVPRWLSASPSAAQLAQPAAADFYAVGPGRVVQRRSYGRRLNPYMTLPGYRTSTTRDARRAMYQLWSMAPRDAPPPRSVLPVQTR